jgi:hypothetical protein
MRKRSTKTGETTSRNGKEIMVSSFLFLGTHSDKLNTATPAWMTIDG